MKKVSVLALRELQVLFLKKLTNAWRLQYQGMRHELRDR